MITIIDAEKYLGEYEKNEIFWNQVIFKSFIINKQYPVCYL